MHTVDARLATDARPDHQHGQQLEPGHQAVEWHVGTATRENVEVR